MGSISDDKYVSFRDCLMYLEEPSSFAVPIKKIKPKYSEEELGTNPPKEASVAITTSSQPLEMYVQIVDSQISFCNQIEKELQLEFSSITVSVPPVVW